MSSLLDPRLSVVEPRPRDRRGRPPRLRRHRAAVPGRTTTRSGRARAQRDRPRARRGRRLARRRPRRAPASTAGRSSTTPTPAARRRSSTRPRASLELAARAGRPRHPRVRRPRAAGAGPRLDRARWIAEALAALAERGAAARRRGAGSRPTATSRGRGRHARLLENVPRAGRGRRLGSRERLRGVGEAPADGRARCSATRAPRPPEGRGPPPARSPPAVDARAPGPRRVPRRERVLAVLQRRAATTAGSRSSGRSGGTRRSRSPRWRCRTSCAGSAGACAPGRGANLARPRPAASTAAGSPSRSTRSCRRRGARRRALVAEHLRNGCRARRTRGRHLRLRALAERVPRRAARGRTSIDWRRVTAFHLDEYVGVCREHPASFRRFLRDRLFDHVPRRRLPRPGRRGGGPGGGVRALRGAAPPAKRRSSRSSASGENGHLAFIDPTVCDFADPADVRVVELDEPCRRQQVHDGAFARSRTCPARRSRYDPVLLARVPARWRSCPGRRSVRPSPRRSTGPVTPACPASILRRHPRATLFLDERLGGRPRPWLVHESGDRQATTRPSASAAALSSAATLVASPPPPRRTRRVQRLRRAPRPAHRRGGPARRQPALRPLRDTPLTTTPTRCGRTSPAGSAPSAGARSTSRTSTCAARCCPTSAATSTAAWTRRTGRRCSTRTARSEGADRLPRRLGGLRHRVQLPGLAQLGLALAGGLRDCSAQRRRQRLDLGRQRGPRLRDAVAGRAAPAAGEHAPRAARGPLQPGATCATASTGGTTPGVRVWDDSRIEYPMRFTASHGFREVDTWPVEPRRRRPLRGGQPPLRPGLPVQPRQPRGLHGRLPPADAGGRRPLLLAARTRRPRRSGPGAATPTASTGARRSPTTRAPTSRCRPASSATRRPTAFLEPAGVDPLHRVLDAGAGDLRHHAREPGRGRSSLTRDGRGGRPGGPHRGREREPAP